MLCMLLVIISTTSRLYILLHVGLAVRLRVFNHCLKICVGLDFYFNLPESALYALLRVVYGF